MAAMVSAAPESLTFLILMLAPGLVCLPTALPFFVSFCELGGEFDEPGEVVCLPKGFGAMFDEAVPSLFDAKTEKERAAQCAAMPM